MSDFSDICCQSWLGSIALTTPFAAFSRRWPTRCDGNCSRCLPASHFAGELSDRFELSRPAVAEHLKVLRDAGLVADEAQGRRRIYRLTAEPLAELGEWLHPFEKFWRPRLAALAESAEELK